MVAQPRQEDGKLDQLRITEVVEVERKGGRGGIQ